MAPTLVAVPTPTTWGQPISFGEIQLLPNKLGL
jgi:hypothetical protein